MKKLANSIVNNRLLIVLVFLFVLIFSLIGLNYVKINSDVTAYLPESSPTYEGMAFMRATFNMEGDAIIALEGIDDSKAGEYAGFMRELDGVRAVVWRNYMQEQMGDLDTTTRNMLSFLGIDLDGMQDKLDEIFYPEEGIFLYMLQLSVVSSSPEAMQILRQIEDKVEEDSINIACGGSTELSKSIMDGILDEMWLYLIFAGLIIIVILFLATTSYLEPIVLLLTLAISIVVNLGSNFFLNDLGSGVSVYTFAASAVLQLGLTMDYAIFLMHSYNEEYQKIPDVHFAMRNAIPRTFITIIASALTTIGGFLALFAMRFSMGMDLGAVLAKGVGLSLISVLFLQPCLIMLMPKLLAKTSHKPIAPRFKRFSNFVVKYRFIIIIVALVAVLPALLLRYNLDLSYMQIEKNREAPTKLETYVNGLSNSVVLIVPNNYEVQSEFIEKIVAVGNREGIGKINVFGVYSMLPASLIDSIMNDKLPAAIVNNVRFKPFIDTSKEYFSNYINNGYTMMSVMIANDPESSESYKALERIIALTSDTFGESKVYVTGVVQSVYDLKEITPKDFSIVSLVSLLIIAVILLLHFRSFKFSIIIIAVIQLGIWLNLAMSSMLGQSINFMGYIIISSVQLGATVDYAILLASKYKKYCATLKPKIAAKNAIRDTMRSIITSASIMAGACFAVFLTASNLIVSDITLLIARGAIISGLLSLTVLPAAMVTFAGFSFKNIKIDKLVKRSNQRIWRTVYAEELEAREIAESKPSAIEEYKLVKLIKNGFRKKNDKK